MSKQSDRLTRLLDDLAALVDKCNDPIWGFEHGTFFRGARKLIWKWFRDENKARDDARY